MTDRICCIERLLPLGVGHAGDWVGIGFGVVVVGGGSDTDTGDADSTVLELGEGGRSGGVVVTTVGREDTCSTLAVAVAVVEEVVAEVVVAVLLAVAALALAVGSHGPVTTMFGWLCTTTLYSPASGDRFRWSSLWKRFKYS